MMLRCGKCAVEKKNPPQNIAPARTGNVSQDLKLYPDEHYQPKEDDPNYGTTVNSAGYDMVEDHRLGGAGAYRSPPPVSHYHEDDRGHAFGLPRAVERYPELWSSVSRPT
jgi:hypothetical protein